MNMSSTRFTQEDDNVLVEFVSKHPCLYNSSLKEYKDIVLRERIWNEIGDKLAKPAKQCKMRWRSIRDHCVKQWKSKKFDTSSKKRCNYWERLAFLEPFATERRKFSNLKDAEITVTSEVSLVELDVNSNSSSTSTSLVSLEQESKLSKSFQCTSKKFKRNDEALVHLEENGLHNNSVTRSLNGEDEVDLFFKAMAATVKKFPPYLIPEVKSKVFGLVSTMEMKLVKQDI